MEFVVTRAIHYASQPVTNQMYGVGRTLSVERRISNGVHYYRYNVEIVPFGHDGEPVAFDDIVITATYTISFRPNNGRVFITSYRYKVSFPEMQLEVGSHTPGYGNSNTSEGPSDDTVDYVVENAIKNGDIREGTYSVGKIYIVYYTQDEVGTTEFLVTLVRSDGYTYRARIIETDISLGNDDAEELEEGYADYLIYTNRL